MLLLKVAIKMGILGFWIGFWSLHKYYNTTDTSDMMIYIGSLQDTLAALKIHIKELNSELIELQNQWSQATSSLEIAHKKTQYAIGVENKINQSIIDFEKKIEDLTFTISKLETELKSTEDLYNKVVDQEAIDFKKWAEAEIKKAQERGYY